RVGRRGQRAHDTATGTGTGTGAGPPPFQTAAARYNARMFTIGRKDAVDEPSAMLRSCHDKLRRFLASAARLAGDEPASEGDVRAAASAVARYFSEALPLHERDEDDTIAPRLAGDAALAGALADMTAQHGAMRPHVAALLDSCRRLRDAPALRAVERGA